MEHARKVIVCLDPMELDSLVQRPERIINHQAFSRFIDIFERVSLAVGSHVGRTQIAFPKFIPNRVHEIITINGDRGVGKTTFIQNILSAFEQEAHNDPAIPHFFNLKSAPDPGQMHFHILGLIDPCHLTMSDNILMVVFDRICSVVQKAFEQNGTNYNHNKTDAWLSSKRKLGRGLMSLQQPKRTEDLDWIEVEYELDQSLNRVRHGDELEAEFHHFLKLSLEELNKDAFIVAVDDIDTQLEHGWQVLDHLRRYFTSPHLITLVTGDLDLYATLVHQHWRNLTGDGKANEAQLTGLVDQFLMKLLPPKNRIHLSDFGTLLNASESGYGSGLQVDVMKSGRLPSYALDDLMVHARHVLGYGQHPSGRRVEKIIQNNPIRSVIQVLDALYDSYAKEQTLHEPSALTRQDRLISGHRLAVGLSDVFQGPLHRFGFGSNTPELSDIAEGTTLLKLWALLRENGLWLSGSGSAPSLSDDRPWVNQALLSVQAHLTNAIYYDPAAGWRYMFLVPLVSMLEQLRLRSGYSDENVQIPNGSSVIEFKIRRFLGENNSRSGNYLGNLGKHLSTILWGKLYAMPKRRSNYARLGALSVLKERNAEGNAAKDCNLFQVFKMEDEKTTTYSISIFSLIGFMADLMNLSDDELPDYLDDSRIVTSIPLHETSEQPDWDTDDADSNGETHPWLPIFQQWRKGFVEPYLNDMNIRLGPEFFSSAFDRFAAGLRSLDQYWPKNEEMTVAVYLSRCLVIWLNSLLLEESRYRGLAGSKRLNAQTPLTSSHIFIKNWEAFIKHDSSTCDQSSLFKAAATFPLWRYIWAASEKADIVNLSNFCNKHGLEPPVFGDQQQLWKPAVNYLRIHLKIRNSSNRALLALSELMEMDFNDIWEQVSEQLDFDNETGDLLEPFRKSSEESAAIKRARWPKRIMSLAPEILTQVFGLTEDGLKAKTDDEKYGIGEFIYAMLCQILGSANTNDQRESFHKSYQRYLAEL